MTLTFRSFLPQDTIPANQQQQRYLQVYPGAQQVDTGLYLSPYFAGRQLVRVAVNAGGELAGYAPYFPRRMRPGLKSACARVVSALNETAPRLNQSLGYKVCRESQVLETEVG